MPFCCHTWRKNTVSPDFVVVVVVVSLALQKNSCCVNVWIPFQNSHYILKQIFDFPMGGEHNQFIE